MRHYQGNSLCPDLTWIRKNGLSYAAGVTTDAGVEIQLLAEGVPGGQWNWTTWRIANPVRCLRGTEQTLERAEMQAECAAESLLLPGALVGHHPTAGKP